LKTTIENIALLKGNFVAGIDLTIAEDGSYDMGLVILKKKKTSVETIAKTSGIQTIANLHTYLKKQVPVVLSVTGKGIIHKNTGNVNDDSLLYQVLPNAKPNLFYVQKYPVSETNIIVSISRKEWMESIISEFREEGFIILATVLGPVNLDNIIQWLGNAESLQTKYFKLSFENKKISGFEKHKDSKHSAVLSLNNEEYTTDQVIPYANALSFFLPDNAGYEYIGNSPDSDKGTFVYKNALKVSGWGMLVIVFMLLLINYLFFEHFRSNRDELKLELGFNSGLIEKMGKLQSELDLRKEMFEKSGLLNVSRLSFYADRIAMGVPRGIILNRMNINPVADKIRKSEQILFSNAYIEIEGTTKLSSLVNDWIKKLRKESWISDVKSVEYNQESFSEPGEFKLAIEVKN